MNKLIKFFKGYLKKRSQQREDQAYIDKQKAEIAAAKRAYRGKICYNKLMQRLKAHPLLIKARENRIRKRKRNATLCGHTWPPVRHVGTVIDVSFLDNYTEELPERSNYREFKYSDCVFIPVHANREGESRSSSVASKEAQVEPSGGVPFPAPTQKDFNQKGVNHDADIDTKRND